MKKRIAAVLAIAATAAIGASSSAQASGDPLYLANFNHLVNLTGPPLCDPHIPDGCGLPLIPNPISVNALLGPSLGDAICSPANQIQLGDSTNGGTEITICKQP
jgi:hypothetical protein